MASIAWDSDAMILDYILLNECFSSVSALSMIDCLLINVSFGKEAVVAGNVTRRFGGSNATSNEFAVILT